MKQFQVKQRFTFGGEKFDIRDSFGNLAYQVEGSFLEIPKRFIVTNSRGGEVCQITKKFLTFYLQKEFTFFKDRYTVENLGLILDGNIWDLDFRLKRPDGMLVAEISKELFHLTSHYSVTVLEDSYADLVISLVVAIDYIEMMEDASN
ncbi:UDP-N-acetylenolpyruvoylglucosamine reductase [Streptococcus suis]|uniref:LURP-one-related/scramblase family protein n=1 Tax=Streptococcus suis TaxID=1307 RepID=UPI00159422EB|nr:UDP-N-acetylenolpyruvoylglucosamine reductase [Streptococcus suis]MCH1646911.1 UDP-N-acetylenolpyruvoylglucosamine reductase [Streptococcus suis]MDG3281859.1 UDP-N-acetylenolpyruvoylglucosamine reductase [Streptococcus suis]NVH33551.1 UDP-N-acetylenolpyruvoylglucosamine reductase [Streptococcus suis]NVH41154.1 UDP-N-acetylenolpyruvoylglucosamine reductase [Streptococcus suis]